MSDGRAVTYLYDTTFDGFLTAVFEAYVDRNPEALIRPETVQTEFGQEYRTVETDREKSGRVARAIRSKMGTEVYHTVWTAFLKNTPEVTDDLYRYLRLGFCEGFRLPRLLTDPRVAAVNKHAALVSREAGHLLQFIRFAQTVTGVYYAEISPEFMVLPIIMPHFAHRLNAQAFVIYDKSHTCSGLFDGHRWVLTTADGLQAPDLSENERAYRKLWKTFYDTVAIEERINPELRRQLMPKKFWKHMTEMTELPVPGSPASPAARPGADPSLPQPSCGLLHDGSSLAERPSSL